MNQVMTGIAADPKIPLAAETGAQITPSETTAQPVPRGTRLSETDARLLHEALLGGEAPLARQSDLIELHKRMVQQLATLGSGLNEAQVGKAAEDRAALVARLDELEMAVNRMEGALRIEFEPVLRRALDEVMGTRVPAPRSRSKLLLALLVGCGLGVALASVDNSALVSILSPYGGSLAGLIGVR